MAKQVKTKAIRIATNKKIPVTVDGVKSKMDLGGYYIIHGRDLKAILDEIKKAHERDNR